MFQDDEKLILGPQAKLSLRSKTNLIKHIPLDPADKKIHNLSKICSKPTLSSSSDLNLALCAQCEIFGLIHEKFSRESAFLLLL